MRKPPARKPPHACARSAVRATPSAAAIASAMIFRDIPGLLSIGGSPGATRRARPYLSRFIWTAFVSGRALPSIVRFVDCQLNVFSSRRVTTLVADTFFPSRSVDVLLMSHLLPSRVQTPSPKPSLDSNVQERMCLALGSQPIHCVPSPTGTPLTEAENDERMKLPLPVQENRACTASPFSSFSSASAQPPISHSSSRSRSE